MKKKLSILVALLLLIVTLPIYGDDNVVHIKSVKDWNNLAKNCINDDYSNDLVVSLDADLSFDGDFTSIPYFNGEFVGNGKSLKNIVLDASEDNNGVFRITGTSASISNLFVEYSFDLNANNVGFVGYNQGKLSNLTIRASLSGIDNVGNIAGYNASSGSVINCQSLGDVYGKHYVGGVVGLNYGLVKSSSNRASVNTVVKDDTVDIKSITLSSLTSTENVASVTDVGGICGSNFGSIKNSNNFATIGYEHVGYNIGGIAGSESGYIYSCVNNGSVFGRKEVGGIVGQFEPAMALNFKEDYLQTMKREIDDVSSAVDGALDQVKNMNDVSYDGLQDMADSLNEASDSLDVLLRSGFVWNEEDKKLERSEEYETARAAFSSSLRSVFDTMADIADANKDSGSDLNSYLNNVNDSLSALANSAVNFSDSITNDKLTFEDVSLNDSDDVVEGKVKSCFNYGDVDGDINVGGIAGALARENDLDPEDDYTITGQTSLNATYKIRAVVDDCINSGKVTLKKNYAGGIAGNQDLGVIKNSINYGLLKCEEADYVGGIVGNSISNVNDNYAKCFIYGDEYVGGIAGKGSKLSGNYSLAQINEANTYIGMVLGAYASSDNELVEDSDSIVDNYYLYDDYGAIDGISYKDKAYLMAYDDFLSLDIADNLKKLYVYFLNDDEIVSTKTVNYGDSLSLSDVPYINEKDNDYGSWDGLVGSKLNNITRDLLFETSYDNVYPTISSSEEPLAYVVAVGKFFKGDEISTVVEAKSETEITYSISTDISSSSNIKSLRVYANGYDSYDVYVNDEKVDYVVDGSYFSVNYVDSIGTITIKKRADYSYLIYIGIGAVVVVMIGTIVTKKKIKKKKEAKKNNK